jgi:DNA/RNA-binding domain of Phe-tRNA-synthetase-like protein
MHFSHASQIWQDYPNLAAGILYVDGVSKDVSVESRSEKYYAVARSRLADAAEGDLAEIQSWRRAFSKMGLKPTQYRCASESLLRRFRKEGSLPEIHPLIDLCNSISLAFATPIAVFNVGKIADHIEVRYATGSEEYLAFSGEIENPEPEEVIYADSAARAHARRWTNRQSLYSAVTDGTTAALIVTEAMHEAGTDTVQRITAAIAGELGAVWSASPKIGHLTQDTPRFDF